MLRQFSSPIILILAMTACLALRLDSLSDGATDLGVELYMIPAITSLVAERVAKEVADIVRLENDLAIPAAGISGVQLPGHLRPGGLGMRPPQLRRAAPGCWAVMWSCSALAGLWNP